MKWIVRPALAKDATELAELIKLSTRTLQSPYYSSAQIEAALGPVFGVDHQLIADGTYFVAERPGQILGCGGWNKRKSFFGGGSASVAPPELDQKSEPARIRAFFVHPDWTRQGIGREILKTCEAAIIQARFQRAELVATLAGEPLYLSCGYKIAERYEIELNGGLRLPALRMNKEF